MKFDKFSLVVTTRCNLRCRLCDEFVPQHKPFPDMTVEEAEKILRALFEVIESVDLLHLSGGGEPFLNPNLPDMIDLCFGFSNKFNRLMVFTNSTIMPNEKLLNVLKRHGSRVVLHASNYGIKPEISSMLYNAVNSRGIPLREIKYYGESQDYGGWVDFGPWDARLKGDDELRETFLNCGITRHMHGNWRTRDGKVHWCQRSQRGMELGIIPEISEDYVDLLDSGEDVATKRAKFERIMSTPFLSACDHCSGNHGTEDPSKRFPAGEQMQQGETVL